jgi:FkbM family methyltransferase
MNLDKIKKVTLGDMVLNVLENDWSGMDFIGGKLWEPHIVQFLKNELIETSNFVDVGSNYGYLSLKASKLCNKVFGFEPQKLMYNLSKKTINDNSITNIEIFNLALGDEEVETNLSKIDYSGDGIHVGEVSILYSTDIGETTKIVKLDNFLTDSVDIIKIDVQGYEKYVLNGSREIINTYKPILIVEVETHQLGKFGYNSEYLFNLIRDLNYHIFFLDYHYPSDFVCVHNSKLDAFRLKNNDYIKPLTENNRLNNCLNYGVNEVISYSDDIKFNLVRIDNE